MTYIMTYTMTYNVTDLFTTLARICEHCVKKSVTLLLLTNQTEKHHVHKTAKPHLRNSCSASQYWQPRRGCARLVEFAPLSFKANSERQFLKTGSRLLHRITPRLHHLNSAPAQAGIFWRYTMIHDITAVVLFAACIITACFL